MTLWNFRAILPEALHFSLSLGEPSAAPGIVSQAPGRSLALFWACHSSRWPILCIDVCAREVFSVCVCVSPSHFSLRGGNAYASYTHSSICNSQKHSSDFYIVYSGTGFREFVKFVHLSPAPSVSLARSLSRSLPFPVDTDINTQ